jgi:serine protease
MSPPHSSIHPSRVAASPPAPGPRRVVVKFRDGVYIPYQDGAQAHLSGEVAGLWASVTSQSPLFSTLRLDRLFTSTAVARVKDLVVLARHMDPGYVSPPDFLTYFVVDCPQPSVAADFAASLAGSDLVERAYVQAPIAPLPSSFVDPSDDHRYAGQWYLRPAPSGVNASSAWGQDGGAGQGVTFADVELAWTLDHEDLLRVDGSRRVEWDPLGEPIENAGYRQHGTAVLGVVMATDNDKGCVGVAPLPARALAIGACRLGVTDPDLANLPDALLRAVDLLGYGDVLLVEMQHLPALDSRQLPVELDPATSPGEGRTAYDLIRLATALGIAVVEPAGNGESGRTTRSVCLDDDEFARFRRGDPAFQDSGAIVVTAARVAEARPASPPPDIDRSLRPGANYGKRVDCYAWGAHVNTLGWSDEPETGSGSTTDARKSYTRDFDGTSSASAIVAGVAVVVQGLARTRLGAPLSAWQLRSVLANPELGTPSLPSGDDGMGVMPDLEKILERFDDGVTDIYLRDCVGDAGLPHSGPLSMSPDIIVRDAPVADPQAAFETGSGTEDDDLLSQDVQQGRPQYLYVRASNRGARASSPVTVEVYWSPPATLVAPDAWKRIGVPSVIPSVPGCGVLKVSPVIVWPAEDVPVAGHYCFVARISSAEDPAPAPAQFDDWDFFREYVSRNNNVTWRNFNVVQPLPGPTPDPSMGLAFLMGFRLVGPWDRPRRMRLEVESDLPDGALVELQGPLEVVELLSPPHPRSGRDPEWLELRLPPAGGSLLLADATLARRLQAECRLRVQLPRGAPARPHRIAIRQLERDLELGRITWRLAPGSPA